MSERAFFRDHSVSKVLTFNHVIEGGQIVGHLIRKKQNMMKNQEKTRSISTVLIRIKTEGFSFSEKVRLGLLNLKFHLSFPKTYVDFHDERSFEEKFR